MDKLVEPGLVAGLVSLIQFSHQYVAAFFFGGVKSKVGMNVAGEVVIGFFRLGRWLPILERSVLSLGGT